MDKKKDNCSCCNEVNHHQEECSCGCNHGDEEIEYIYITLDDDREVKCAVLGIFEWDNQDYIAIIPEGEERVFIYKYDEDDNGPLLSRIERDEEFKKITDRFNELLQ